MTLEEERPYSGKIMRLKCHAHLVHACGFMHHMTSAARELRRERVDLMPTRARKLCQQRYAQCMCGRVDIGAARGVTTITQRVSFTGIHDVDGER